MKRKHSVAWLFAVLVMLQTALCVAQTPVDAPQTPVGTAQTVMEGFGICLDGSREYVTKKEFAGATLKLLGVTDMGEIDAMRILTEVGIFPEEDSFAENADVQYKTVIKTAVNALGYGQRARAQGYAYTAADLKLGFSHSETDYITPADCYQLFFNMIDIRCMLVYSFDNGARHYKAAGAGTILNLYLKGFHVKGVVQADETASLSGYGAYIRKNHVYIDGIHINTTLCDTSGCLGSRVEIYGTINEDEYMALCMIESSKNNILTIDIKDISDAKGFDSSDSIENRQNPRIIYEDRKTLRLADSFTVIYNGSETRIVGNNDFLGEVGKVTFTDADGDGEYELISIKRYELHEVMTVDVKNKLISFTDGTQPLLLPEKDISIFRGGRSIYLENIQSGSVLCVFKGKPDAGKPENMELYVLTTYVTGKVLSVDKTEKFVVVGDAAYPCTEELAGTLKVGETYTLTIDMNGNMVYAKKAENGDEYAYFSKYYADRFSEDIQMKTYDMAGTEQIINISGNVTYTGSDESGNWLDRAVCTKERFKKILAAHFGERRLIRMKPLPNGGIELAMPRNMCGNDDYAGYSEDEFTLEYIVPEADRMILKNNSVISDNYYASAGFTKVIVDNMKEEEDLEFLTYSTSGANTFVKPCFYLKEALVYDATETLCASVVVMKCDYSQPTTLTSGAELAGGNIIVVDSVQEALSDSGELVHILTGFEGGKKVAYSTVSDSVEIKHKTVWSATTSKTKISQLSRGDVIIPVMTAANQIKDFNIIMQEDMRGSIEPYYMSYWGGISATADFCTAYSKVVRNYENKILKLAVSPDTRFRVQGNLYIIDKSENKITACDAAVYICDEQSGNADTVFVGQAGYGTKFIIIYRD